MKRTVRSLASFVFKYKHKLNVKDETKYKQSNGNKTFAESKRNREKEKKKTNVEPIFFFVVHSVSHAMLCDPNEYKFNGK